MAIKRGRFGVFLACTGYPDCKIRDGWWKGTRIARQPMNRWMKSALCAIPGW